LNIGLITPKQILNSTLEYSKEFNVPLNSLEGFVRQIIGWREFIRAVYHLKGSKQRTTNFWNFSKKIPNTFYNGSTGIIPVDNIIKNINKNGYAHHIERLMVLGNIMCLMRFDPNEVYKWFMEMFIDSYDWVMVPNVYGMSQFADGGIMSTKPYISGSNYILKMSNYKKEAWCELWDALYWRFIDDHRDFFNKNYRMKMMVTLYDKKEEKIKKNYIKLYNDI
jgi:deoxyribodipyrimidine photolyase-related protein